MGSHPTGLPSIAPLRPLLRVAAVFRDVFSALIQYSFIHVALCPDGKLCRSGVFLQARNGSRKPCVLPIDGRKESVQNPNNNMNDMLVAGESRMSNNITKPNLIWNGWCFKQSLAALLRSLYFTASLSFSVSRLSQNSPDTSFAKMIPLEHPLYFHIGQTPRDDLRAWATQSVRLLSGG